MNKNFKLILIPAILIVLSIVIYFAYNQLTQSFVPADDMKYCDSDEECVPVDCGCSCGGCGGFSYDDVVNKKYADEWYNQKGCKHAEICPMVCCPARKVACENNVCVVKEGIIG